VKKKSKPAARAATSERDAQKRIIAAAHKLPADEARALAAAKKLRQVKG
jgi:hypothetical protein